MDLGGIINHTEQLIGGLKDLGHTVDLKELINSQNSNDNRKDALFEKLESGIQVHQGKGWNFSGRDRLAYGTWRGVQNAKQILSEYDLVIWTVPVPSRNRQNIGNMFWPDLYDLPLSTKQIAFIHDGNAKQGYPWLLHIQDKLVGVACVHHCALASSDHLTVPRKLILNPQLMPIRSILDWDQKEHGFVNMQTFKAWKHVHELVDAIRFMKPKEAGELREVAGKGIEYQYMTSVDKCKPQYLTEDGQRIWDLALANGMTHHDYWNTTRVDEMLNLARVHVDPSWSRKYSQFGGHYNRVSVDAMIRGCVSVAHRLGMGEDMFQPGYHYIDVSKARDSQDYAQIVQDASNLDIVSANHFRENCRDLLGLFDRRFVAAQVISLATEEAEGTFIGSHDLHVQSKAEDVLLNHFGIF